MVTTMRNSTLRAGRAGLHKKSAAKGIAVLLSAAVAFRLLAAFESNIVSEGFLYAMVRRSGVSAGILRLELGVPDIRERPAEGRSSPETESDSGEGSAETAEPEDNPFRFVPPAVTPGPLPATGSPPGATEYTPPADGDPGGASAVIPPAALDVDSIVIKNTTSYEIDIPALFSAPISPAPRTGEPSVLIFHTHGSEAYTPAGDDEYEPTDSFRTEDSRYNVIRVGDELAECLEKRGVSVIHDTGLYDFPSYQGSYTRSAAVVSSYTEKYPSIRFLIDIHRDAIAAQDGSQHKTVAHIDDRVCSQVMFFVGTDAAGLQHPGWRDNLGLALRVQNEMNALYPSLSRPIYLSRYRYNQHKSPGSLLLEVGSAGNTLEESLAAVRYFADAYANVILSLTP
jgi:stage II sporulation protein P